MRHRTAAHSPSHTRSREVHRLRASPAGVAALLSVAFLAHGPAASVARAQEPPSIVLIMTDDQRWDTLPLLPTITSELVQKGIQFNGGFVVAPLCSPGRAGFLSGQYPHHNDVWRNMPPHGGFDSFVDTQSLAVWLQSAGYTTSLIGKYFNGYPGGSQYVPPGWNYWLAFTGEPGYYDYTLNRNGIEESHGSQVADYSTDVLRDEAAAWIRNTSGPIFLDFTPYAPHLPTIPADRHMNDFDTLPPFRPPSYNEDDVSDKPAWLQAVPQLTPDDIAALDEFRKDSLRTLLAVDEAVGSILTALSDSGRLANTMIVFTSDNGYSWGEHRWQTKIAPYEEDIRIPLVIRYDPYTQTPRQENRTALNIDIAPTFLELAGAPLPPGFPIDGVSLMPLIRGGEYPQWRTEFIFELLSLPLATRPDADPPPIPTYCGVRRATAGRSTIRQDFYSKYSPSGDEELYDIALDPYQLESKVTDPNYSNRLTTMRGLWDALCPPPPEP